MQFAIPESCEACDNRNTFNKIFGYRPKEPK